MITVHDLGSDPPAKILLIEDNDGNRQLMSDYLIYHGYDILALARGGDFVAAFESFQPQLILLDLKLPDVDGYALLEQIQQNPTWQQVPVIIVSAYAFQKDQQRALDLGARRYIIKPIRLTALLAAIEEELSSLGVG
jgi:two-component system cell cycle response regulator DivK